MAETLRLDAVEKEYGETVKTRVLHGVSFSLKKGEFTALIGPSGSGKSTLLNLMGLLDRPTRGNIFLAGTDTGSLSDDGLANFRAQHLGFIFQFHHLLPAFTALENVMMPAYAHRGFPTEEMRQNGIELLKEVGLQDYASRLSGQLSGGQQQRVAIARALAGRPGLVLADEPTGNLDTHTADQIFELMRDINQRHQTTFLVVTHDMRLAQRCDRIIEVVDGRIVRE